MTEGADFPQQDVESRLAALEAAVSRLTSMVQPSFAVLNVAAPVAETLLKEAAQHEFVGKFFALMDMGEALLKYTAAIAFASVTQAGRQQAEDVVELCRQPATLGKLSEQVRFILRDASNTEWPLDVLRTTFVRANNKPTPTARYLLDEFINIRNSERGHGAYQASGYYEELYLKNYFVLHDCVQQCKFVRLPLLYVHSVDHASGQYAYRVTLLMGGTAVRMSEPVVTPVKVRAASTCLWDGGVRLLPLGNFLTHRYCRICALEHLFFAERITEEKVLLYSHIGNHRMVLERTDNNG